MNIWEDLPKPFTVLAPMEGVTDIVFREVIATAGRPDLFFTEFTNVSSYASDKGRHNALERLKVRPGEQPIIAQIWGKDPTHFAKTASALAGLGFNGVDLNFGCPDKNVNRTGGGAAMIKTPDLAVECFRNATNSTALPVSIKTRLGWSDPEEYQTWLATLLQEQPAALTVHLRTKKEMSKVPAHYELIPAIIKLRNNLSPTTKLVMNGDIKDLTHIHELHAKFPEVDGFMIGRGVFTNPYCFTDHTPTRDDLMKLLKLHLETYDKRAFLANVEEHKGKISDFAAEGAKLLCIIEDYTKAKLPKHSEKSPHRPYEPLKHFFKIYINNFPGAADLRAKLMDTHSVDEAYSVIKQAGEL